jgi:hypothetical protein
LKIKKKGLPNKLLAYELWKELEVSKQALDAASLRAGKLDAASLRAGSLEWL